MMPNDQFHFLAGNQVTYDNASLVTLYQPLIGSEAVMTYSYLVAFFDNGRAGHKFTELLNHLQFGFQVLEENLERLGAVGLLDLYQTPQGYLIQLYQARGRESFLTEPVLRSLLINRIGEVAVEELDSQLPLEVQKLTKSFSQVFSDRGELYHHQPSRSSLDMGHFKDMMVKEGLRFADENQDILGLSHLAQTHHLTWFDLYRLAKQTAVNHQISLKRLTAQLEQKEQLASADGWSDQERATLKAVKSHDAVAFLQLMKQSRQAMVLDTERKLLKDLAELGFLDEVINVLVLRALTTGKTANLNKVYIMKLANDFSYQKIKSAEEALTYLKQIKSGSSAMSQKKTNQGTGQTKTNVPAWSDQDYKNQTSQEEQERLAAYKRRRLEELGKGD